MTLLIPLHEAALVGQRIHQFGIVARVIDAHLRLTQQRMVVYASIGSGCVVRGTRHLRHLTAEGTFLDLSLTVRRLGSYVTYFRYQFHVGFINAALLLSHYKTLVYLLLMLQVTAHLVYHVLAFVLGVLDYTTGRCESVDELALLHLVIV